MKYLISKNFKIVRKGTHVTADESRGEWIYDTDVDKLEAGQLQELAESNKLKPVGKKASKYRKSLHEAMETMENVAEQNGPTQTEIVDKIVQEGHAAGKTEDDMLIQIVQAGISFRRAGKMFKETIERLGLRTSVKDVKELAQKLLAELDFKPTTYAEFEKAVDVVLEKSPEGAERGQAVAAVKAYAKSKEIELPKRPKGQRGAIGFKGDAFKWILDNPNATEADLTAYLNSKGKDPEKVLKRFVPVMELCKKFATKHGAAFQEQAQA